MNKKYHTNCYLLIFLLCFFTNCMTVKKESIHHRELTEKILAINPQDYLFSNYLGIFIFTKTCDDNKIGYIDIYGLIKNYVAENSLYKNIDYQTYINNTISNELHFKCEDVYRCFTPNDTILSAYKNNTFSEFVQIYPTESLTNEYRIKNSLTFNSILTVIYCLYQSEYYTHSNDYIGGYFSMKLKDWPIPEEENIPLIIEEE